MKIHYYPFHERHHPPFEFSHSGVHEYPDKPDRIESIISQLRLNTDAIDAFQTMDYFPAYLQILKTVHDPRLIDFYLDGLKIHLKSDYVYPEYFMKQDHDVHYQNLGFMGKFAYHCTDTSAPLSVGTVDTVFQTAFMTIQAMETYLKQPEPTYLLTRPPGHHAGKSTFGGFCYLNNAAIAAQMLSPHGKTAVLDIDFHHGNGTQDIFYDRDDVIFVSLHADPKVEYPFLTGYADEMGIGKGKGCNLNIPLSLGIEDTVYAKALAQAVEFLQAKHIQFLVLSLSFDFLKDDPVGGFHVSPDIFKTIAKMLSPFSNLVLVQEGGYQLERIGDYAKIVWKEFLCRP